MCLLTVCHINVVVSKSRRMNKSECLPDDRNGDIISINIRSKRGTVKKRHVMDDIVNFSSDEEDLFACESDSMTNRRLIANRGPSNRDKDDELSSLHAVAKMLHAKLGMHNSCLFVCANHQLN